jgi:MFS family permease
LTVACFALCTILQGAVGGFLSLLVVRAMMGFAEGPVLPITQSVMAQESSPHRRGFNMGVLQNGVSSIFGAIMGPPLMVTLAEAFGWRNALFAAGAPGLLVAWLVWRYLRDPDRYPHTSSNVRVTMLGACGLATWSLVLMVFTPLYLVQQRGLSPQGMSAVMSALGVAIFAGGFVVPMLSDRFGRKPVVVLFSLIAVLAPLAVAHLDVPLAVLAAVAFVTYLGVGCFPLLMATIPSESLPAGTLATAMGLIMGVAEVVGGVIGPTAAGLLGDRVQPSAPFYLSAGGALLAGVVSLALQETAPAALQRRRIVRSAYLPPA